eukprot:5409470-Prymnesium_polylepis.1
MAISITKLRSEYARLLWGSLPCDWAVLRLQLRFKFQQYPDSPAPHVDGPIHDHAHMWLPRLGTYRTLPE